MSNVDAVSWAELLQQPTKTAARLSSLRALRVRRRDAEDLMLMTADRADREGEVIDFTARLLSEMLKKPGGADIIHQALPTALPWTRFLPIGAVEELAAEFAAVASAAAAVSNTAPISQLLTEWRNTAEIYADPELYAVLSRPTQGDFGAVPAPDAV